jgi:hypothetical protein
MRGAQIFRRNLGAIFQNIQQLFIKESWRSLEGCKDSKMREYVADAKNIGAQISLPTLSATTIPWASAAVLPVPNQHMAG